MHIASYCCCMVCIVDEMKGEVRSEDMLNKVYATRVKKNYHILMCHAGVRATIPQYVIYVVATSYVVLVLLIQYILILRM